MIQRFFKAQQKFRNKKDWVSTVVDDLEELELGISFENIQVMKKSSFNHLVNKSIAENAFKRLEKLKLSHSKVENVKHLMLNISYQVK